MHALNVRPVIICIYILPLQVLERANANEYGLAAGVWAKGEFAPSCCCEHGVNMWWSTSRCAYELQLHICCPLYLLLSCNVQMFRWSTHCRGASRLAPSG